MMSQFKIPWNKALLTKLAWVQWVEKVPSQESPEVVTSHTAVLLVPESLLRWADPPEMMQGLCMLVPKVLPLLVEGHPPVSAEVCSQQELGPLCLGASLLFGGGVWWVL